MNNVLENRIVNLKKLTIGPVLKTLKYLGFQIKSQIQNLGENLVKICKDLNIKVSPMDIEGCHRLPLGTLLTH